MGRSALEYLEMLQSLMPKGKAWNTEKDSVLYEFLYSIAQEFYRLEDRWEDLFLERDTRYTDELISKHEYDFGLPDECTDSSATLSERRNECHTKLIARGGLNKQYYIDLAAANGYEIQITEFTPFWCGLGVCGDLCGDQWVIFVWEVTINFAGGTLTYFTSGGSVSGDPLVRVSGIDTLVCLLNKYKPAHTIIKYVLDGYEFSSAFSNAFDSYPSNVSGYLYGAFDKSFSISFDVSHGGAFTPDSFDINFDRPI